MGRYTRRASLGLGLGLVVTACGGGSSGSGGSAATPPPPAAPPPPPSPPPTSTGSIAAIAAARNMRFGSTFAWSQPGADAGSFANPDYAALLETDCNLLVPENELKWQALRPNEASYTFDRADDMLAYAEARGMAMRGHTLLWYKDDVFPAWLRSYDFGTDPRATAERLVREHVQTVTSHYGDRIASWDVVNEAVDPSTGNLRDNVLANAVGGDTSLLDLAFTTARAELPNAELVYNDYMDWGTPTHRAGVLALLRGFRDRGVPVDTLGVQSHIGFYSSGSAQGIVDYSTPAMRDFLDQVVAMGYKLKITEMDINDRNRAGTIQERDADCATLAAGWLDLFMSYPELDDVLVWGMCDRYSWLQYFGQPRADGTPLRPCPYDTQFAVKPLHDAYHDAFEATTVRN